MEQHPPLHACVVPLQAVVHVFGAAPAGQVELAGQSVVPPHPHVPPPVVAWHTCPVEAVVQLAQTAPTLPQAARAVPATHVPALAAEQHPSLQGVNASQLLVQTWVVVLHAFPLAQSADVLHPQKTLEAGFTQAVPFGLAAHVPHTALPNAHCVEALPTSHLDVTLSQQPPLQGLLSVQSAPHVPFLQACPTGQSFESLHPQAPLPRQTGPALLVVQSVQAPPEGPHAALATAAHVLLAVQQKPLPQTPLAAPTTQVEVQAPEAQVGVPPVHAAQAPPFDPHTASALPATQLAPLQQPPLQASPFAQLVWHWWVLGLQAVPVGQSAARLQPHAPLKHAWPSVDAVQSTQFPAAPQLAPLPVHAPVSLAASSATLASASMETSPWLAASPSFAPPSSETSGPASALGSTSAWEPASAPAEPPDPEDPAEPAMPLAPLFPAAPELPPAPALFPSDDASAGGAVFAPSSLPHPTTWSAEAANKIPTTFRNPPIAVSNSVTAPQ
jgi:hypothetical protein